MRGRQEHVRGRGRRTVAKTTTAPRTTAGANHPLQQYVVAADTLPVQIHVGEKPSATAMKPLTEHSLNKINGGFWTSSVLQNGRSSWQQYSPFQYEGDGEQEQASWVLPAVNPNVRVLHLQTLDTITALVKHFPLDDPLREELRRRMNLPEDDNGFFGRRVDWQQAIHELGVAGVWFSPTTDDSFNSLWQWGRENGWDVESTVWSTWCFDGDPQPFTGS